MPFFSGQFTKSSPDITFCLIFLKSVQHFKVVTCNCHYYTEIDSKSKIFSSVQGPFKIGEQILIELSGIEWVPVLLQALKQYILHFAQRQALRLNYTSDWHQTNRTENGATTAAPVKHKCYSFINIMYYLVWMLPYIAELLNHIHNSSVKKFQQNIYICIRHKVLEFKNQKTILCPIVGSYHAIGKTWF